MIFYGFYTDYFESLFVLHIPATYWSSKDKIVLTKQAVSGLRPPWQNSKFKTWHSKKHTDKRAQQPLHKNMWKRFIVFIFTIALTPGVHRFISTRYQIFAINASITIILFILVCCTLYKYNELRIAHSFTLTFKYNAYEYTKQINLRNLCYFTRRHSMFNYSSHKTPTCAFLTCYHLT